MTGTEVGRLAGVSRNTVSLVMRDSPLVASETKRRVLAVAERVGYQPHAAAAALRSDRSRTLGYLVHRGPGSETLAQMDVFRSQMVAAITDVAQQHGYFVLQTNQSDDHSHRRLISAGRVDGMLIDLMVGDDVVRDIAAAGVPAVVVGRAARGRSHDWARADEAAGCRDAVVHLVSRGHTDIGLITADAPAHPIVREREKGFATGLSEHGLVRRAGWRWSGDWTFESGRRITAGLLTTRRRPTALLVLNELMAAGALAAALDAGVGVPADLAVVTVEDSHWVQHTRPALTAVHVPMYEVARRATESLHARISGGAGPEQTTVPTRLVIRESA